MTRLFSTVRAASFALLIASATVVLGLSANFAQKLLPYHRDWIITTLVVSVLTVTITILIGLRSKPWLDCTVLFVLAWCWCMVAAFTDNEGQAEECDAVFGTIPAKNGTTYSAVKFCYERKTIEALSWGNFAALLLLFILFVSLTLRMAARGHHRIWNGSMSELQWFEENPYGHGGYGHGQYPNGQGLTYGQPVPGTIPIYLPPGHGMVFQNGQFLPVPLHTQQSGTPLPSIQPTM